MFGFGYQILVVNGVFPNCIGLQNYYGGQKYENLVWCVEFVIFLYSLLLWIALVTFACLSTSVMPLHIYNLDFFFLNHFTSFIEV